MQTNHPHRVTRVGTVTMLGLALSLGAASPSWAQDAPAQPAPVPGAGQAAAQSGMSGSGATTGAGPDPISATTMMRATGTPATSSGSGKKNRGKKNRSSSKTGSVEPWFGRRVLLLLPLQVGPGFNADRAFGQAILSRAEAMLQSELEATGKFSVIRAHRFSPLIQRALQEKRLTSDEAEGIIEGLPPGADPNAAVDDPITVQGANTFLNRFTFDQLPMIAQFNLEEVRSSTVNGRAGVQAQVSGRLYEARNPLALKAPVLTSDTVIKGRNNIDRYLEAARLAFGSVADEFVAPLEDIALPQATAAGSNSSAGSNTPDMATQPAPDTSMGSVAPAPIPAPDTTPAPAPIPAPAAEEAVPIPAPPADAGAAGGTVAPGVAPGTEAPAAGG